MDRVKSKTRILFVSDFTFTHTIGGTEVATSRLINGVAADERYEVFLFAGEPRGGIVAIEPDPRVHIYRFTYLPFPGDKGFNNFILPNPIRMWRLMRQICPDIIHIHIPSPFDWIVLLMARRLGIPTVYTSHMFSEHFFPEVRTLLQRLARRGIDLLLSRYMRSFDLVIHPSEIQRETVERLYGLSGGLAISNGFVPFGSDASTARPPEWMGKTVFFTVSRLSPEKNLPIVIDAFDLLSREYSDILLVIVGDGVLRGELEAYAREKKSRDMIVFVGQKRGEELAAIYKTADIFVAASSRESEGLTALEAISFGKPIILSDAPGNAARQFLDGNGFLFRDHDAADLSRQMAHFLHRDELADIHSKRWCEIAEGYRFEHSLRRFQSVYTDLISSISPPWKSS